MLRQRLNVVTLIVALIIGCGGTDNSEGTGGKRPSGAGGSRANVIPSSHISEGYLTSGDWHGYVWTFTSGTGDTITPDNFDTASSFPLCASGTMAASEDYSSVALIGWDVNQALGSADSGSTDSAETVTPQKKGITVGVTNNGGTELRVQLQGGTDATDRWCATITGSGGFIPYSSFNTQCWVGGAGTAYSGQPFNQVMVLVPSKQADSVSFDFCITSFAETDGTASTGLGTGGSSGSSKSGTTNKCAVTFCPGGGIPSSYPACQCPPKCALTSCPGGGTPSSYPMCQCPKCALTSCPGGGTPDSWPSCQCPKCPTSMCPGGGTPGSWPACQCPTPIRVCTNSCPSGTPSAYPACICPPSLPKTPCIKPPCY